MPGTFTSGWLPWWGHEPDQPLEPDAPNAWIDESGVSTGLDRPSISADTYLNLAADILILSIEELTAKGSLHRITKFRSLIIGLAVERWRFRPSDFSSFFRRRNDVVSRWVRWDAQRRQEDPDFRAKYERLDHDLSHRLSESPPTHVG